jgi:4-amino-4-deoxy-L-arabinose transferase-like glycosyltransferase
MSATPTTPVATAAADRFSKRHVAWLLGATLLGLVLRFWQLGEWSLWIDEAHTWRDATLPIAGDRGFFGSDRGQYPLAFLLVRGLLALGWIANDEFGLRVPFAVVGALSVPVLALAGRRIVGPSAAVAAAWLCAVHPWHLFWSQNARGYALMFLFALLATNRLAAWAEDGRLRHLPAALLAVGMGVLSHPTGALLPAGAVAFLLLRRFARDEDRRLPIAAMVVTVLAMVATVVLAKYSPFQKFLAAKADPSPLHLLQTVAYYFRPEMLVAGLVGLVLCGLQWPARRGLFVACLMVAPFLLLLAVGSTLVKTTARYAFAALPIWLLLAGRTIVPWFGAAVADHRTRMLPSMVAVVALAAGSVTELVGYYGHQFGQRARWREACEFVVAEAATAESRGTPPRLRVLTVNQPSVIYYLCPSLWAVGGVEGERITTHQLVEWEFDGAWRPGGVGDEVRYHQPGVEAHFAWHRAEAKRRNQRFAVVVSLPELQEIDVTGSVQAMLRRDYRLALHLPCWVGPKDESIYVYFPRDER